MFDHICSAAVFIAYHSLRGNACWKGGSVLLLKTRRKRIWWLAERTDNLVCEIGTVVWRTGKLLCGWRWGEWKTCDNSGTGCGWYRIRTRVPEL